MNYPRFAEAFPEAEVHAPADCAQLVEPWGGMLGAWTAAWNLQAPANCEGCKTGLRDYVDHLAQTWPFSLLAYQEDGALTRYFAYPLDGTLKTATDALLTQRYDPHPNARYFLLPGNGHVMLGGFATLTGPGGISLRSGSGAGRPATRGGPT